MVKFVDLQPHPRCLRGVLFREEDLVQGQFLDNQGPRIIVIDLTALLPDQIIVIVLLALVELLEASDPALHALTPHPAEVTRLKLIEHFLQALLFKTILVEELAAKDA